MPIVRTFAPVVAGVARMRRSVFLRYNVVGAGLWVAVATMLGYLLADLIGDSIDTYILPIIACHRARVARAATARVAETPALDRDGDERAGALERPPSIRAPDATV